MPRTIEENLEITIKHVLRTKARYHSMPMVARDLSFGEISSTPSVLALVAEQGMCSEGMNQLFLEACYSVIQEYAAVPGIENGELAQTIIEKWHTKAALAGEAENPKATISRLITMLESGSFLRWDSPYFALCHAIVKLSAPLKGWHFSDVFKYTLSLKPQLNNKYHPAIVNLGKTLGYFEEKETGVCMGVSMAWLSECMVHEEARYAALISEIVEQEKHIFVRFLKIKEKVSRQEALTLEDERIFQILAFYETVVLYQSPELHYSIFDKTLNQNEVEAISPFVSSKGMATQGGIAVVSSEIGIYTREELIAYFKALAKAIDSVGYTQGELISCLISGYNHVIGLTYNTASGFFRCLDINPGEPQSFNKNNRTHLENMSKMLLHYGLNAWPRTYTAMTIRIITTGSDVHRVKLQNALASLEKFHVITKAIAQRRGDVNLAWVAAISGKDEALAVLVEYGADLTVADNTGATLATIAAHNGYHKVLAVLGKHRVDFNVLDLDGMSPAYMAAHNGHDRALRVLAAHGADFNIASKVGVAPVFVAVKNGHDTVLGVLAEHGADLNAPQKAGYTPAFVAAQYGHNKVLVVLAKHGVNINAPCFFSKAGLQKFAKKYTREISLKLNKLITIKLATDTNEDKIPVTPKDMAYIMGHEAVVAKISELMDLDPSLALGGFNKKVKFSGSASVVNEGDNLALTQKLTPK